MNLNNEHSFIANIGQITKKTKSTCLLILPPKKLQDFKYATTTADLSMRWVGTFNNNSTEIVVDFSYYEERTLLSIIISGSTENIELNDPHLNFRKVKNKQQCVYLYQHEQIEVLNLGASNENESSIEKNLERIESRLPLVISNAEPLALDVLDLADLINDKQIAIYTGAGISAGVVPTMSALSESLNFAQHQMDSFLKFVNDCFQNPDDKITIMNAFYDACTNGKASSAHEAVTRICEFKGWSLLTENVDLLHQQTGVAPLGRDFLSENLTREDFLSIDIIITIGLQTDESHFLSRFKQHNPRGVIAAINLAKPNYLANNDFLIRGDAQALLPLLYTKLLEMDYALTQNI
ncbi:MAG: hypothetical protein H0U71_08240 [Gammaproteobacteria bacterium]|nr:hypothetical protein [Gammaproteobacteria bacterium]